MDEAGLCKSKSSKKIPWAAMPVRVRFPSEARQQPFQETERAVFLISVIGFGAQRKGSSTKVCVWHSHYAEGNPWA